MNMNGKPAIHTSGLTKSYRNRGSRTRRVVDGLDVTIEAGQVFGLLGINGAGKTTTIKMICGLIEPDAGWVQVNGFDVRTRRGEAMAQIGAVLEGTRNIHWQLSSWQNLRYFAALKGCHGRQQRERSERLLTELGLWDRRKDPVGRFSRGMQQKVAIACALIADPPIILLDEPTLGLDFHAARTVKAWVRQLAAEEGKTILLTSHQLDLVQTLCDRVAVIHGGQLVVNRPTAALLEHFRGDSYDIRLAAGPEAAELPWRGMRASWGDGQLTLSGEIGDQQELWSLLELTRVRSLPLLGVDRREPSLEEVFLQVVGDEIVPDGLARDPVSSELAASAAATGQRMRSDGLGNQELPR
jgi:ABC-2 type transport system ATP-binding protein